MADPVVAVDRPAQELEIDQPRLVTGKHREAAYTAGRDVVDAVRFLDAEETRHVADRSGGCGLDLGTARDRYEVGTRDTSGV